ncbi:J domain-containing protein [bacterium]|nr:J domain-containing protein [bacterium]
MEFKEIDQARKLLGLGETASLKEIRDAYRTLSLKYHPDRNPVGATEELSETFKKITEAYNLIIEYCSCYRYSFTKKESQFFSDAEMDKEHFKNFFDGWITNFEKE